MENPSRPHSRDDDPVAVVEPVDRLADRVLAWIDWVGIGRLVATGVAVVAVGAGAFWLVRTPPPPTTADLPRTTAAPVTGPPPAGSTAEVVTVHVTGAVSRPGVYVLRSDARVQGAIEIAGGATDDGDPDAINLAAPLVDGARIYVPVVGEAPPADVAGEGLPPGPVDVNRATVAELDELPGVGPATANAIVVERDRNGPFVSVDDLERVPGIGPAKLDALRDLVTT